MGFGNCPVCSNTRPIKGYNTVADLFVDIAKQWSPSNEYKPDELMPTSGEWVMLICPDCGGEHSVRVSHATAGNIKCPYCNEKKVAPGKNSLDVTNPELVPLWSKANTRDISTVASFMSYTAYWDCPECGGTYPADINKMVAGEVHCKYCADEAVLPGFNSFAARHNDLLEEWDFVNNYVIADPDSIGESSHYKAWFKCMKDLSHGSYEMLVYRRVLMKARGRIPCPICRGVRRKKHHFV